MFKTNSLFPDSPSSQLSLNAKDKHYLMLLIIYFQELEKKCPTLLFLKALSKPENQVEDRKINLQNTPAI